MHKSKGDCDMIGCPICNDQPPAKPPRVWFIQKPIAHNCPVGQFGPLESQAAVFQDFMPTVSLQKHEWVPVVERSAYDFWKKRCLDSEDAFKIQAQEYEKVVAERDALLAHIAILEMENE